MRSSNSLALLIASATVLANVVALVWWYSKAMAAGGLFSDGAAAWMQAILSADAILAVIVVEEWRRERDGVEAEAKRQFHARRQATMILPVFEECRHISDGFGKWMQMFDDFINNQGKVPPTIEEEGVSWPTGRIPLVIPEPRAFNELQDIDSLDTHVGNSLLAFAATLRETEMLHTRLREDCAGWHTDITDEVKMFALRETSKLMVSNCLNLRRLGDGTAKLLSDQIGTPTTLPKREAQPQA